MFTYYKSRSASGRLLSLFLVLTIAVTLFCGATTLPILAATVSKVKVTVTAPAAGELLSSMAVAENPERYKPLYVNWYLGSKTNDSTYKTERILNNDEPFKAGYSYIAEVCVSLTEGNTFSASPSFSINGTTAQVISLADSSTYYINMIFTVSGSQTLLAAEAIKGVVAPARDDVPVSYLEEGTHFFADIAWEPGTDTFKAGTIYTAVITLTAQSGYTFKGSFTNTASIAKFTVGGRAPSSWVSNNGTVLVFKTTFPPTASDAYSVTVTNGTGSGNFKPGDTVTIKANAAPAGMVFDRWECFDMELTNENAATTTFTMPNYAITVSAMYKSAIAAVSITAGNNQSWKKGVSAKTGVSITCSGASAQLETLKVDGITLKATQYSKSGTSNAVITLQPSFLETLDAGEHAIDFYYPNNNTTKATLFILADPPKTTPPNSFTTEKTNEETNGETTATDEVTDDPSGTPEINEPTQPVDTTNNTTNGKATPTGAGEKDDGNILLIIVIVVVALVAAGGAVWYFVFKKRMQK